MTLDQGTYPPGAEDGGRTQARGRISPPDGGRAFETGQLPEKLAKLHKLVAGIDTRRSSGRLAGRDRAADPRGTARVRKS